MLELASQITLCLILAGLLGLLIGYLLAKQNCEKQNEAHHHTGH
jgi:uncharacterized protein YneF (UPF0154 family)